MSIIPREISTEGLELIGKGGWGSVYRLDEETIVKVYDSPKNLKFPGKAKEESDISREVFKRDVPTAISFSTAKCGEFDAAIYERITGDTLGCEILKHPEGIKKAAANFASLGRKLHHTPAPAEIFPDVKDTVIRANAEKFLKGWFNDAEYKRWNELIKAIPDRPYMVHTDFHYDNVLLQKDTLMLIDVGGMSHGHPVFDFTSMYIWGYHPETGGNRVPTESNREFFDAYTDSYFEGRLKDGNKKSLYELFEFLAKAEMALVFSTKCPAEMKERDDVDTRPMEFILKEILSQDPEKLKEKIELLDRELFV